MAKAALLVKVLFSAQLKLRGYGARKVRGETNQVSARLCKRARSGGMAMIDPVDHMGWLATPGGTGGWLWCRSAPARLDLPIDQLGATRSRRAARR